MARTERIGEQGQKERPAFVVVCVIVLVYVAVRAALVPFVHDEAASVLWFVQPQEWLPDVAHADANNHFLSSAVGILFTELLGRSLLVLRLGSVMAFALHAWAVWRIGQALRSRIVRYATWCALLLCPFALDFFSLFRGYGMELAAWAWALDGFIRFLRSRSFIHLHQVLVAFIIANAAIVALVPMWGICLVICALIILTARSTTRVKLGQGALLFLLGSVPLLLAARIAMAMKDQGLLYHGSTSGFFEVTVRSLCKYVLGSGSPLLAGAIVVAVAVSTLIAVAQARRSGTWWSPALLLQTLLWCDVLARIAMAQLLEVNYPEDRAGIHFVPLLLLCFAFTLDAAASVNLRSLSVMLFVLPLRSLFLCNTDHTTLWAEQSVPARFLERVKAEQLRSERPLIVGGYHQLALCWPISGTFAGVAVPSLQTEAFPTGLHDFRIADARHLDQARMGYTPIDSAQGPGLWLLQRTAPWPIDSSQAITSPATPRAGEFHELLRVVASSASAPPSLFSVQVPITLARMDPDMRLVLEISDSKGQKSTYDATALSAERVAWNGDTLTWARGVNALPGGSTLVLYCYNPRQQAMVVGEGHVLRYWIKP